MVPMRDGVRLATDVYRLDGAAPRPVLLARTPYDKERALVGSTKPRLKVRSRKLEAAPIGWQLFALGSSQSDCTALTSLLDTYATRLLAQALSLRFNCAGSEGCKKLSVSA